MPQRTGLIVASRMLAALIVVGIVIIALSYVVVFPEALTLAYLALTMATVVLGGIRCLPYLDIGSPGYTLGPADRHVRRWVPVTAVLGFLAMAAVVVSGVGGPQGDAVRTTDGGYALDYKGQVTEVSRTRWLAARQLTARGLAAAPASFTFIAWYYCLACSRAEPSDLVERRRRSG